MVGRTRRRIIQVFGDGSPKSLADITKNTGLTKKAAGSCLFRCWKAGLLRSAKPIRVRHKASRGRAGATENLRSYYLYALRPKGENSLPIGGRLFVEFDERYLDRRGAGESKSQLILRFLKDRGDPAWFSKEVMMALKGGGVRSSDVMTTVRRYERKGLLFVRGYQSSRETPFKDGFLLTWIDKSKLRDEAIRDAVERTEEALLRVSSRARRACSPRPSPTSWNASGGSSTSRV